VPPSGRRREHIGERDQQRCRSLGRVEQPSIGGGISAAVDISAGRPEEAVYLAPGKGR
jgi:hypothetical protein